MFLHWRDRLELGGTCVIGTHHYSEVDALISRVHLRDWYERDERMAFDEASRHFPSDFEVAKPSLCLSLFLTAIGQVRNDQWV